MTAAEIRTRFLEFFKEKQHAIVSSEALVPKDDPSVLFITAGMQPLVPYLLGKSHPQGRRLANVQKCIRTQDIDEVGDNTHDTFFEMLGNWSLGDYFKEEAIGWSYEFLTSTEKGLGLDPARLYVTVFEGNNNAPKDTEAYEIWKKYIPEHRIYYLESNWWSVGENGPCGPDTEMFYDMTAQGLGDLTLQEYLAADKDQKVVEIWNNVFMEYEKKDGAVVGKLAQRNVDTGSGLERITMGVQKVDNIFATDLFLPLMEKINELTSVDNERAKRIIADHIRTSVFIINEGVTPSNGDRGYVLRRLLRRAVRYADMLAFPAGSLSSIAEQVVIKYRQSYPEIATSAINFQEIITVEESKFRQTLQKGLKEFEKGIDPFILFTTYGFPIELTAELAKEKGIAIDTEAFAQKMYAHQEKSRSGAEQKFKGGLGSHTEKTIQLHTAHHLLLAALQQLFGKGVKQRGSNITDERLRIDFSFDRKLTEEEKHKLESIVNGQIAQNLRVTKRDMTLAEAEKVGAEMEFGAKYGAEVSVYFIEDEEGSVFSKECCGGPHVSSLGALGTFRILKEEAVAQGIRRIKATLE